MEDHWQRSLLMSCDFVRSSINRGLIVSDSASPLSHRNLCNIVVAQRSGYLDTSNHTKVSPAPSHPALWIYRVSDTYTRCGLALGDTHGSPIEGPEIQILNSHRDRHREQTAQRGHPATTEPERDTDSRDTNRPLRTLQREHCQSLPANCIVNLCPRTLTTGLSVQMESEPSLKDLQRNVTKARLRWMFMSSKIKDVAGKCMGWGALRGPRDPALKIITGIPPCRLTSEADKDKMATMLNHKECFGEAEVTCPSVVTCADTGIIETADTEDGAEPKDCEASATCGGRDADTVHTASHAKSCRQVIFLEGPSGAASGDTLLIVRDLSDKGAEKLARGYWMPPKKANGEKFGFTIIALDNRIKYGTADQKVRPCAALTHWPDTADCDCIRLHHTKPLCHCPLRAHCSLLRCMNALLTAAMQELTVVLFVFTVVLFVFTVVLFVFTVVLFVVTVVLFVFTVVLFVPNVVLFPLSHSCIAVIVQRSDCSLGQYSEVHSSTEQCSAGQSRAGHSSAAQGRAEQHRAEQSSAEQNSAEQSRRGQCGAEQCGAEQSRAAQGQSRVKRCSERTTVNCNGDSLQCSPAVSLTRPMCGSLPALPVASEKSSAVERTTVNCNGDSLQCSPAVSLTRPMCGFLPALPVASEKSSAMQSRAGQYRTEMNSEHQKVVSSAHLRSFNIYFVQSSIILFFYLLPCTKLPSSLHCLIMHLRSFNVYFVQSFIILPSFYLLLCTKLPSSLHCPTMHLRRFNIYFVQSFTILPPLCPPLCTSPYQGQVERDQRKETAEIAHCHKLPSSTCLLPLSRALKLGRKSNDIETNQNLTNKLNEHNK